MEDQYIPESALNCDRISDHLPLLLPIPCDTEEKIGDKTNRVRVGKLTLEEWVEKDAALQKRLEKAWLPAKMQHLITNERRLHTGIENDLNNVFYRERQPPKQRAGVDPFERFLLANIQHLDTPGLLTGLEEKDTGESDRKINRIGADRWQRYLQAVRKDDTRAFFAYLAKAEGRKRQGFVSTDASRMLDEKGQLVLTPHGRMLLIMRTFHKRFAGPAVTNPSLSKDG